MIEKAAMRINLLLQRGAALSRDQWHGAAQTVALRQGTGLSFVGFYPPFVKNDLKRIARFGISGFLGMFGRDDYAGYVRKLGVPVVSVYGGAPFAGVPQVGTEDHAIGRMGPSTLRGRGSHHSATLGFHRAVRRMPAGPGLPSRCEKLV